MVQVLLMKLLPWLEVINFETIASLQLLSQINAYILILAIYVLE